MDPHFQHLFSLGLGVAEPWYITDIDPVPSQKNPLVQEMHISIDFRKGARFNLEGGAGELAVHDTRERTWRHLNFFQYRCYVTARVPRVETEDGRVVNVNVSWARNGSGFTLMMEGVVLSLVKHMPVSAVAREMGEHDTRIWRVIDYHVEKALLDQDFSDVNGIGVDEYSHKGHNHITVFVSHPSVEVDGDGCRHNKGKGRVLFCTEGKDKAAVQRFLERFKQRHGEPDKVEVCTSDMIHGFRNAMREAFSNAVAVVDKFHVVKNCQDAVDAVRRREMRSHDKNRSSALNRTRYIWLKNPQDLTDIQRRKLSELAGMEHLDTVKAYDFRLRLQQFYDTHKSYSEEMVCDFEQLALDMCNS